MTRKTIASQQLRIDALEAQLVVARTLYRALRDSVTHTHSVSAQPTIAPIVTRYRDALGREWIKTRVGNRASSRLAIN